MELNLDRKGQAQPEQAIANMPVPLSSMKAPPVRGTQDKPHKKEMEVR